MMNIQVRVPALFALCAVLASPLSTSGCEERVIPVTQASMCQEVVLPAVNVARGPFTLEGFPLLHPEVDDEGVVRFRAPSVLRETELTLHDRRGTLVQRVVVSPDASQVDDALGLVPGCGPFAHGVASGDPAPERVYLWTRVTPSNASQAEEVRWEVAESLAFTTRVAEGAVMAEPSADHTVQVEVTGLQPGRTYYYRFTSAAGERSELGRTRTTPTDASVGVRLGVISCSSIYSGYFNAYQRLAERDDLDAIVHLGDYLYDFVDDEERVRVPVPEPAVPDDVVTWRARHAYYLSDPNLRAARAAMPWVMIWDNHDLDQRALDFGGGLAAYREWNAISPPRVGDADSIGYRTLSFGPLLDIIITDVLLHRGEGNVAGTEEPSILGETQFAWLTGEIERSQAVWRVIGSQKIVAPIEGGLALLGGSTWDAYEASRAQLFGFLADGGHSDNVFISGDAHITVASDLPDPREGAPTYDPATGAGSVGVELMPGSISRGNVDESVNGVMSLVNALDRGARSSNPQFAFLDLVRHGYGLLHVTAEQMRAELWYSPILEVSDSEELGGALEVHRGENHWRRPVELPATPDTP
ncbi:MAG: alkaline phosphatase D family protein [Sandaracinaceae bacterium]|nr:alkaline phosphatase D family protein [Sandaracinaceae bacterium]